MKTIQVTNDQIFLSEVSQTFHGRDIFAPVAAHLATGLDFKNLGNQILDYDQGKLPNLQETGNDLTGEIVYIDSFGNLISNIPHEKIHNRLKKPVKIQIKNCTFRGLVNSYSEGSARDSRLPC